MGAPCHSDMNGDSDGWSHAPSSGYARHVIREMLGGIDAELATHTAVEVVEIVGGNQVATIGDLTFCSFAASTDPSDAPTPDTPAVVETSDGKELHAVVVAVGDESVTVSVREALSGDPDRAVLRFDPSFVLGKLRARLVQMEEHGADMTLIDELLCAPTTDPGSGGGPAGAADGAFPEAPAEADQERAANLAVDPGVRLTWGPPGTGKTKVLGRAVAIAARRGDRVLVVAHANAAVDVAAARIAAELADDDLITTGSVLRVGPPLPGSEGLDAVLPASVADRQSPERSAQRKSLRAEMSALSDHLRHCEEDERVDAAERLHRLREELEELETSQDEQIRGLVESAQVVVTTLSRAIIAESIWSRDWDVVMVDEVSMAPLPMVLALAMRGPRTLSALGDPRQLPPINRSDEEASRDWFGTDLFSYAGFDQGGHDPLGDPRLSTLRVQFRMGETICAAVGEFAYDGMLRTHDVARNRGIRLAEASPVPGAELVVVDITGAGARCRLDPDHDSFSRLNPTSALLAAGIASELSVTGCESVALVSPYRAQVRWLAALTAGIRGASASTVHRLQGSEADAVVLDLTDSSPLTRPSRLTGEDPDLATRLLTVAASRARGKLVVMVDMEFVAHRVALKRPVRRLLEVLDQECAERVCATDLVAEWTGQAGGPVEWHSDWTTAVASLPPHGRSSVPHAEQPNLVTGSSLVLGGAGGEGAVAVVHDSRVVERFLIDAPGSTRTS